MLADIKADGAVSGQFRQYFSNYKAYLFRDDYIGTAKQDFVEKVELRTGMEIANYQVENESELTKPLKVMYDFSSNDMVEVIGDKMYIAPLLFLAMSENPFKQENRQYPVDFIFPFQQNTV